MVITNLYHKALIRTFIDYKITFVNSQHDSTNSKGDFVLINPIKCLFQRHRFGMTNSINKHLSLEIPSPHTTRIFNLK